MLRTENKKKHRLCQEEHHSRRRPSRSKCPERTLPRPPCCAASRGRHGRGFVVVTPCHGAEWASECPSQVARAVSRETQAEIGRTRQCCAKNLSCLFIRDIPFDTRRRVSRTPPRDGLWRHGDVVSAVVSQRQTPTRTTARAAAAAARRSPRHHSTAVAAGLRTHVLSLLISNILLRETACFRRLHTHISLVDPRAHIFSFIALLV